MIVKNNNLDNQENKNLQSLIRNARQVLIGRAHNRVIVIVIVDTVRLLPYSTVVRTAFVILLSLFDKHFDVWID